MVCVCGGGLLYWCSALSVQYEVQGESLEGTPHPLFNLVSQEWDALYADLPSRQAKLPVRDRSAVVTTDDETAVLKPVVLQVSCLSLLAASTLRGCVCPHP